MPITTDGVSSKLYQGKFVSDLWQVGGFSLGLPDSFNKTDLHDITLILLKVALSNTKQQNKQLNCAQKALNYLILLQRRKLNK
jgi:hypothetical protein